MNRSKPPSLTNTNQTHCQSFDEVPKTNSALSRERKLELLFDGLNRSGVRYGVAWDNCLVNLGPVALFSESKVTIGCAKDLEVFITAQNNCLM